MINPAKTPENVRISALRHRIHEIEGIWISSRVIRAMLSIIEPKPVVEPWEKYRDMKHG